MVNRVFGNPSLYEIGSQGMECLKGTVFAVSPTLLLHRHMLWRGIMELLLSVFHARNFMHKWLFHTFVWFNVVEIGSSVFPCGQALLSAGGAKYQGAGYIFLTLYWLVWPWFRTAKGAALTYDIGIRAPKGPYTNRENSIKSPVLHPICPLSLPAYPLLWV